MSPDLSTLAGQREHYKAIRARLYGAPASNVVPRERVEARPPPKPAPVPPAPPVVIEDLPSWAEICAVAREALQWGNPRKLVADIIRETARRHGVSAAEIVGARRTKQVVAARHEAIALAFIARPDLSTLALGRAFGGMDHTSILYAVHKMGVHGARKPA